MVAAPAAAPLPPKKIRIGLALGCEIAETCRFARKNYFYPDIPKNFQTSQYDEPIAFEGGIEIELEDTDDIQVLPGAARALDALVATGRCAIVTSCTRDLALARLRAAGLRAPDVLVAAEDVVRGKPDPEPFLLAARTLGVDPSRCLVVEDAPAGLRAGRAAGMTTLAVSTTHAADELAADGLAHHVVPDLAAVAMVRGPAGVHVGLV